VVAVLTTVAQLPVLETVKRFVAAEKKSLGWDKAALRRSERGQNCPVKSRTASGSSFIWH
jgi:hypothetical protein